MDFHLHKHYLGYVNFAQLLTWAHFDFVNLCHITNAKLCDLRIDEA
jgi:hypothetical protein